MHEKVKQFFDEQKKKEHLERTPVLIELGLYEKEYNPAGNIYSAEYRFREYDQITGVKRYYKKVAIDVTDEEFEKITKIVEKTKGSKVSPTTPQAPSARSNVIVARNKISKLLLVVAWFIIALGFIVGLREGIIKIGSGRFAEYKWDYVVSLVDWIITAITGIVFIGFSEIINLLEKIKNKK